MNQTSSGAAAKAAVIVCIVLGVLLVAALVAGIILHKKGYIHLGQSEYCGDDTYECDLSPIGLSDLSGGAALDIAWLKGKVEIRVDENGDAVRFSEEGADGKYNACRRLRDGKLSVRYTKGQIPLLSFLTLPEKTLIVTVPASFDFTKITVNGGSTVQSLGGLSAGEITVKNASGDVTLSGCTAASLTVDSASGRVYMTDCRPGKLSVTTKSGDAKLRGIAASDVSVKVSSGRVILTDVTVTGKVTAELASGRLEMTSVRADGELSLLVSSGDVRADGVTAPRLRCETKSGGTRLSGGECDTLTLVSKSGSISYEGKARKAELQAVSGNSTLRLDGRPEEITYNGASGGFTLALRDTAMPIEAHYRMKSGEASCDIPGVRRDDSQKCFSRDGEGTVCRIDVNITSGNFHLTPFGG